MLQTIKNLGAQSVIYGLGNLLTRLLGFVLLPLYTRYLSPADYGVLSLLGLTAALAGIVSQMGLGSAMFREVIYAGSDRRRVESTSAWALLTISAVLFGLLIWIAPTLSAWILRSSEYAHLMRLVFATGVFSVLDIVILARLRIEGRAKIFAALSLARFVIGISLNVYLIAVLKRGLLGLIEANLITAGLFAVLYAMVLLPSLRRGFSWTVLRQLMRFGAPLVPANLSGMSMTSADHYFLQYFGTTAEVGIYSLGYRISLITNLTVQAIQLAWPAQMFEIAKQPDAERQFARILTYYAAVVGFVALGVSVLAPDILKLMTTPEFYSAYRVVPMVCLAYVFYGMGFITVNGLATRNKMQYAALVLTVTAAVNLGLNAVLIPRFGMMGAAWATFASYALLLIVQTAVNLRFWRIPYEYGRLLVIGGVWCAVFMLGRQVAIESVGVSIGVHALIVMSYAILAVLPGFLHVDERAALKRILRGSGSKAGARP